MLMCVHGGVPYTLILMLATRITRTSRPGASARSFLCERPPYSSFVQSHRCSRSTGGGTADSSRIWVTAIVCLASILFCVCVGGRGGSRQVLSHVPSTIRLPC